MSVDSDFEDVWREVVKTKVSMCSSLSEMHEDEVLDREIQKAEVGKCIFKLKNSKKCSNDGLVRELLL